MNTILKKLQERADNSIEEYWILKFYKSHISYNGFNLSNKYKGNFESAFLQIRYEMLKTNYIDILKDEIQICKEDDENYTTVEEMIESIIENFQQNDTLWMERVEREENIKINMQPFGIFYKKEKENFMEKNPYADRNHIMDILIKKWDELDDNERNKYKISKRGPWLLFKKDKISDTNCDPQEKPISAKV